MMPRKLRRFVPLLMAVVVGLAWTDAGLFGQVGPKDGEWWTYGGDLASRRYRPFDQINRDNFKELEVAWRFKTDSPGPRPEFNLQATPLMVNGVTIFGLWTRVPYAAVRAQETAPAHSVWEGVYTAEQAKRGEALYNDHCASCHGATLTGAESAPALTGFEFSANWNGLTLGDLFERIRVSMPQDDPGKLGSQQKVDILAHLLSVGKFPAGKIELPRESQALNQIRYESTKP